MEMTRGRGLPVGKVGKIRDTFNIKEFVRNCKIFFFFSLEGNISLKSSFFSSFMGKGSLAMSDWPRTLLSFKITLN